MLGSRKRQEGPEVGTGRLAEDRDLASIRALHQGGSQVPLGKEVGTASSESRSKSKPKSGAQVGRRKPWTESSSGAGSLSW